MPAKGRLIAALSAATLAALIATAPAFAAESHSHLLIGSFGSATSTPKSPVPLSNPTDVAVDEKTHDVYVTDPGVNEQQEIVNNATGGTFTLSFGGQTTGPIPYNAHDGEGKRPVREALEGLSSIGIENVVVEEKSIPTHQEFAVTFVGALASTDVEQLTIDTTNLTGAGEVETIAQGHSGSAVEKFSPSGEFILIIGEHVDKTTGANVCTAASHDECGPGEPVQASPVFYPPYFEIGNYSRIYQNVPPGQFTTPYYLAVDNSSGPSAGDLYVSDAGDAIVQKFDPSGQIVSGWGKNGEKDGTENTNRGNEPYFFGSGGFGANVVMQGLDVDGEGNLFVLAAAFGWKYTQAGKQIIVNGLDIFNWPGRMIGTVDNSDDIYGFNEVGFVHNEPRPGVYEQYRADSEALTGNFHQLTRSKGAITGFDVERSTKDIYQDSGSAIEHFGAECADPSGLCPPLDAFGSGALSGGTGVAIDSASNVYVADAGSGEVKVFADIRPKAVTGPATEVGETTAALSGEVEPAGHGDFPIVECRVEYGITRAYGETAPCAPDPSSGHFTGPTAVTANLSGLTPRTDLPPGSRYHYRFVAVNAEGGTGLGADRTFTTTAPPSIEGTFSSNLTATSADLHGAVSPNGLPTACEFEYGTTDAYGSAAPCEPAEFTGQAAERVRAHLAGLQAGATYHFRVIAKNALGSAASEDQTFEFFPPSCPNSAVRQQTGSAYLPDCRAYELVSPGNAGGTMWFSGGPNPGTATRPSRFAYAGQFGAPPGTENAINTVGDLYVATRTDSGWVSHYVGPSAAEAGCASGPPNSPYSHGGITANTAQNEVPTDPGMSRFLDWADGTPMGCLTDGNGTADANWQVAPPSNAPFLWAADGAPLGRFPSGFEAIPGAAAALTCPVANGGGNFLTCSSDAAASGDLTHLFFSSNKLAFAPGGLTHVPGSAYDDNLATGEITLISKLGGGPLPQDEAFAATPTTECGLSETGSYTRPPCADEEFIRFPGVSTDGSRVLMSTMSPAVGPLYCGEESAFAICPRYTDYPVHLYMSVGDTQTYEVSASELTHENVAVHYAGMTPDGSHVFFTTDKHLTAQDPEHVGTSIYEWSAEKAEHGEPALTLVSAGQGEGPGAPGNSGECAAAPEPEIVVNGQSNESTVEFKERPWTAACGVELPSTLAYSRLAGLIGGNGLSDSPIARNGDVLFFSPERLDGDHGVAGWRNLYDYREGSTHFVVSFPPKRPPCKSFRDQTWCAEGPLARFEVTPDGGHIGFVTNARLNEYDNAGHLEMYTYSTANGRLVCDSCNPSGQVASSDVFASQDGRFLTDDGRAFFSTEEALVSKDTNEGTDVYEYADGRPQLITPGTGTGTKQGDILTEVPGLIGVSGNGTDAYVATFDTLTSEDHNGNFFKFYDARTNGGFAQPTPVAPCAAAEECHGAGSEAPSLPTQGTAAGLKGGNVASKAAHHHRKKHRHRRRRRAAHRQGGAKR